MDLKKKKSFSLKKYARSLIAMGTVAILSATLLTYAPSAATAADARSFNPGNILLDENLYNGSAMKAAEVQKFLNETVRGGKCTIGQPNRKPGDPAVWGGATTFASNCLNGYRQTTTSEPANKYCKAYTGAKNETAAQIITKVGQACGISQRVLITMLEKEQSLVTDEWPTVAQFSRAMGYGCPDTGPGHSANCDKNFYGFFNQVYSAAWQFKVYKQNPQNYSIKPKQTNTIQWHPNKACGTSQVYIENAATAALYIYTPYRPNQAALDAQWGTGNSCSTYGNRNFFLLYSDWFGSPNGFSVAPELNQFYTKQGGAQGVYGAATAPVRNHKSYISQEFAGGTLFWSKATGASGVNGAIRKLYNSEGGATSYLGLPIGAEQRDKGVSRQEFQNGTAYWSQKTGASVINGAIRALYNSEGGPKGYLGLPIGPEHRSKGVSRQEFEKGTAYWSQKTGTSVINGAIRALYNSEGGPK
ncbi:MAG: LGFP repeat-containing protein, partial [Microbacteriaceae bacterium]